MLSEKDLIDTPRGELGIKSDWPVLLVQGFTVGLDLGGRSSLCVSLDRKGV